MDCIFCAIANKSLHSYIIAEDENHLAFLSIFPNTDGATVVIPKKHYPSYGFFSSDEILKKLIIFSKKVALVLDKSFDDVGRTGLVMEGFGVDHLHTKLYPMHGTPKSGTWTPIKSTDRTFFEVYQGYIASNDSYEATKEHLEKIQQQIIASSHNSM